MMTILCVSAGAFCFTACDGHSHNYIESKVDPTCTKDGYTLHLCDCGESYMDSYIEATGHSFVAETATEAYCKVLATCTKKGVYFKSCTECGEKGEETFEYGEPLGHKYVEEASEKYLKSPATCTQDAIYYKSCVLCGEKGEETFNGGIYENGAATGHTFTAQTATEEYLKSPATCAVKAVYYKSCLSCGKKGNETFEYGEVNGHNYVDGVCDTCGGLKPTEGLEYSLSKNKDYYIITGIGSANSANLVIPSDYNGMPVKEIGEVAFDKCEAITSLFINKGVEKIGNFAFWNCKNLSDITLPDSITSLWYASFSGTQYYKDRSNWENDVLYVGDCLIVADSSLSGNHKVKEGTRVIANGAFMGNGITGIDIPEGVTHIGDEAFSRCAKLIEADLPASLVSLGDSAFSYCETLITMVYYGNEEQWENVKKGWWWDYETAKYVLMFKER